MNSDALSPRIEPSAFAAYIQSDERDLLQELLADKRSLNTRKAYQWDLTDFFVTITGHAPTPLLVSQFLELRQDTAKALVLKYKSELIAKGLAESTVNRRLSSIKSLVKFARRVGRCDWNLQDIEGEKVQSYRDTSGVNLEQFQRLLAVPDRTTLKGKRDYALLRLLWENVLRRGEVAATNVSDFDASSRTLRIYGKGKGLQAEDVKLSAPVAEALSQWLAARPSVKFSDPLFVALDRAHFGHRLTGTAIYHIVGKASAVSGITKQMSPHRIRHSGITAALDATGGNVRQVQKLSRHAKIDTLLIYDDNRHGDQETCTNLLSALL